MKTLYYLLFSALVFAASASGVAQCDTLRHNATWFDGWISCETSENPNSIRGESHWINYDLGQQYTLFEMRVWNMNAPEYLDFGLQNVIIDISDDGENWTEVGQFGFPQADGSTLYEGMEVMDFDSARARFVLITAVDNYGGACYGLSEIRIRARDLCPEDRILWIGGNGNWDVPGNWCNDRIPDQYDDVVIPTGVTVTIPYLYTAHVANIQVDPGSVLKMTGNLVVHKDE